MIAKVESALTSLEAVRSADLAVAKPHKKSDGSLAVDMARKYGPEKRE